MSCLTDNECEFSSIHFIIIVGRLSKAGSNILALTAISEANALAFFNYQRGQTQENEPSLLANCRRKLAKALIYNELLEVMDVAEEDDEEQQARKLRSVREGHHELVAAPPYSGKWDGERWKEVYTQYLWRKCEA